MPFARQRADGGWYAQVYLGRDPLTGKTRWYPKPPTFDTKRKAEQWAKASK